MPLRRSGLASLSLCSLVNPGLRSQAPGGPPTRPEPCLGPLDGGDGEALYSSNSLPARMWNILRDGSLLKAINALHIVLFSGVLHSLPRSLPAQPPLTADYSYNLPESKERQASLPARTKPNRDHGQWARNLLIAHHRVLNHRHSNGRIRLIVAINRT